MSVIITEFRNSLIITQGWTHWTERLTNIDTKVGTHRTERLTNIWLPLRVTGGDAQDGKTNTHTTL